MERALVTLDGAEENQTILGKNVGNFITRLMGGVGVTTAVYISVIMFAKEMVSQRIPCNNKNVNSSVYF